MSKLTGKQWQARLETTGISTMEVWAIISDLIAKEEQLRELEAENELLKEPECEWTRSETPQWYWKTACGDWFDDRGQTYCSCGKRVKYIESEE